MRKIACIVGTRPDFIKIAPLFWYLEKNSLFPMILIHTGQHYEFRMLTKEPGFRNLSLKICHGQLNLIRKRTLDTTKKACFFCYKRKRLKALRLK